MTFDLRQLRYVIAAADNGSLYRAARALNVEQSTLSRNVMKLERVVNARLLIRSRSGVTLTDAGVRFVNEARGIVDHADRMLRLARAGGRGTAGSIVFGLNSALSAGNLRSTLVEWRRTHGDVDLDGVEDSREALVSGLNRGSIDIVFLMGDAAHEGFQRASLWSERALVALPATHALATRDMVQWSELRDEKFVLPRQDPGQEICNMIVRRLSAIGFTPDIKIRRLSREAIMNFLSINGEVTVTVSDMLGSTYPGVVLRDLHDNDGQTSIGYSGYWRRENSNPVLRRFLDFLRMRYALSLDIAAKLDG